jgi:O-antigen biosynthesis protein WbqP
MKLIHDSVVIFLLTTFFLIPFILVFIFLSITSSGPVLYWSTRIGKNNDSFKMPKFRTMFLDTPDIASHLLDEKKINLIFGGHFLRKTSLDEIPQLWSILKGDMSLVGPRPALYNQKDLIKLRTIKGVHKIKPGITGWAQVNGRDELSISDKVSLDEEYVNNQSFWFDIKILWMTFLKVLSCDGVSH